MRAEQTILTRGLPKTGQVTVYKGGDDGDVQAGWWKGRKIADNKTRFIAKALNGDDVVIDLATGLMWPADGSGEGCAFGNTATWDNSIIYLNGLDFAGFTDWRLPNFRELSSIIDYGHYDPIFDVTLFPNTLLDYYWSSTCVFGIASSKWCLYFKTGSIARYDKTEVHYLRGVRGGL